MTTKDYVVIGLAALVGFIFGAAALSPAIAVKKANYKVETTESISSEFKLPSEKYFNRSSINPTQRILIGNDANNSPF